MFSVKMIQWYIIVEVYRCLIPKLKTISVKKICYQFFSSYCAMISYITYLKQTSIVIHFFIIWNCRFKISLPHWTEMGHPNTPSYYQLINFVYKESKQYYISARILRVLLIHKIHEIMPNNVIKHEIMY